MSEPVQRLHPEPGEYVAHTGLYLNAPLAADTHDGLFLYTNYVASIDGRIAVAPPGSNRESVPRNIANPRDWRLFQELAGHADILITSGRYLREFTAGTAQDALPVGGSERFADIRRSRVERGLAAQPDVAVLSASLDFTLPGSLIEQGRRVIVFTVEGAHPGRRRALTAAGAEVIALGSGSRVPGSAVHAALGESGYRRAYSVTGPYVLHTFLADGLLDALFVTTVHRLIGGQRFSTLLHGDLLDPAADFRLRSLYLDSRGPGGVAQTYARYDRLRQS